MIRFMLSIGCSGPPQQSTLKSEAGWFPAEVGEDIYVLKADVTKAHRRVKVLPKDWRYQLAKLGSHYWINKVGMSSAQLYWGRQAALLLRLLYYMFGFEWGSVYVDDFAFLLCGSMVTPLSAAILATLLALGVPLSWKPCL